MMSKNNINVITFDLIQNIIEEIKERYVKLYVTEGYFYNKYSSLFHYLKEPYRILKNALSYFDLELNYVPLKHFNKIYYFSSGEKKWSLDFLIYCLKNSSNIAFDLSYFKERKDRKELFKFVKNKVYGAFLDSVEKYKLFDKLDLEYECEYRRMNKKIKRKGKSYSLLDGKEYILPINHFEHIVFYHKYGIQELPSYVKESINGKDIIDAGAFIGDSALILNELKPRRIYAFEPLRENIQLLNKTIELNNLRTVVVVGKALASKKGISYIIPLSSGSFISGYGEKIQLITLDDFFSKNSLNVGLIKIDVEGYEPEVIKGAENTIKNEKPVLIVSLYHTGEEFFEIPKLLKSWVPEYTFRFLNLNHTHATFERVLIAYC